MCCGGFRFTAWKMHGLRPALYPLVKRRRAAYRWEKKINWSSVIPNTVAEHKSCCCSHQEAPRDGIVPRFWCSSAQVQRPLIHFGSSFFKSLESERWLKGGEQAGGQRRRIRGEEKDAGRRQNSFGALSQPRVPNNNMEKDGERLNERRPAATVTQTTSCCTGRTKESCKWKKYLILILYSV